MAREHDPKIGIMRDNYVEVDEFAMWAVYDIEKDIVIWKAMTIERARAVAMFLICHPEALDAVRKMMEGKNG